MDAYVQQAGHVPGPGRAVGDSQVVYFVHVPKTAGTSFRLALEREPSFHMLYDYGEKSADSTPALLAQVSGGAKDLSSIAVGGMVNVICGHVHFRKYARYVQRHNVLSILRNPVERLVSEYQHLVRNENYEKPFAEFVSSPIEINKQWKMLDGVDVHAGGLFGLASHYGQYLALARQRFGVSLDVMLCNQAPEKDKDNRYAISADDAALAFALNDKEMPVVLEVAQVFAETLRHSGVRTTPPGDARFNCNFDGGRQMVGWVSSRPGDCFFIQLSVNGQPRAVVGLDRQRPDVVAKGLSEEACCGFSYPLALLGVRDGDRVGMTLMGAEGLRKTIVYGPREQNDEQ